MKPLAFVLGFLWLFPQSGFSQRWTVQQVSQQLPLLTKFQAIPTGDDRYWLTIVRDTLPPNHVLAEAYHIQDAYYLGCVMSRYSRLVPHIIASRELHLPTLTPAQRSAFLKDTLHTLNTILHRALQQDTLLNRYFLAMTAYGLQAKGIQIEGYTVPPKIRLTMPALLKITAQFIESVSAGDYQFVNWRYKLDTNWNIVPQQLLVEAFCKQVLWKLITTPAWGNAQHDAAFLNELRSLETRLAALPDSPENRLVIQQAMQDLIARNALLEKELRKEYERMAPWLGFVLAN